MMNAYQGQDGISAGPQYPRPGLSFIIMVPPLNSKIQLELNRSFTNEISRSTTVTCAFLPCRKTYRSYQIIRIKHLNIEKQQNLHIIDKIKV